MASLGDRIVVLIDMDCFFCQVEAKLNPLLKGKPMAVVQYSSFGPGGIIAVNYEARDFGVTRHMKGDEAKEKCPQIELVTVPPIREKPDTGRYRIAGKEVVDVLKQYCTVIERASVDEAYLDITDMVEKKLEAISNSPKDIVNYLSNTFVVGYCDNESNDEEKRTEGVERWLAEAFDDLGDIQARKLAIAGTIVEELRSQIYAQCEYRCSAGISYNKILAKLACGLHKPNRQTILPSAAVPGLYSSLPVNKVRNLGGKFGNIVMESLGCNVMADVLRYSLQDLQRRFDEKTGVWLYNIARGIDNEPVVTRLVCKSIGASKNFPGKQAITKLEVLQRWATELSVELVDRLEQDLEENQRRATTLTISYHYYPQDKKVISQSRACPLPSYKCDRITKTCVDIVTKATQKPIAFLGMSASKFVPVKGSGNFVNYFKTGTSNPSDGGSKIETVIKKQPESLVTDATEAKVEDLNGKVDDSESTGGDCVQKDLQEENNDKKIDEKTSEPDTSSSKKPSSLINSTDLKKTFDGENLKNSFFMNFLKDSKTSLISSNSTTQNPECSNSVSKSNANESCPAEQENDSPDLFEGLESPKDSTSCNELQQRQKDVRDKPIHNESTLVQLQEIFPDLDNIDPSVVQLLPIELQREANAYLKSKKSIESLPSSKAITKNPMNKVKPTKTKSTGKSAKKNNFLHNFFVKNSSDSNDSLMRQCPECSQVIREEKFTEHADFHVARNLHRVINQSITNEARNSAEIEVTSTKRKLSAESPEANKKSRNIESFFT